MSEHWPSEAQQSIDTFYWKQGPCCAGCDHWRSFNPVAGECDLSPPVGESERLAPTGLHNSSMPIGAGKPITPRDYHCGQFRDQFDWTTLPQFYLRQVGHPNPRSR